jgi:hypothetical protein
MMPTSSECGQAAEHQQSDSDCGNAIFKSIPYIPFIQVLSQQAGYSVTPVLVGCICGA